MRCFTGHACMAAAGCWKVGQEAGLQGRAGSRRRLAAGGECGECGVGVGVGGRQSNPGAAVLPRHR